MFLRNLPGNSPKIEPKPVLMFEKAKVGCCVVSQSSRKILLLILQEPTTALSRCGSGTTEYRNQKALGFDG